jgi:DNA-binding response OmpR family regulator
MNVFLVEDNEDTAAALGALFELEGIGFRSARSGAEALHAFRDSLSQPADVLMIDLLLPDMPGARLVQELASGSSLPPIVLHSAASPADLDAAAGTIGAVAVLRKPCNARELVETIRRAAVPLESDAPLV